VTALLAGSLLAIVVGAVTLVLGWIGARAELIWASIGGSALAAVLLAFAYARSKAEVAVARGPRRRASR
jgi:hypothetical protein